MRSCASMGLRSRPEYRTVIYATRDRGDALAVSDSIAVLDSGRAWRPSARVLDQPANELVAQTHEASGTLKHRFYLGNTQLRKYTA